MNTIFKEDLILVTLAKKCHKTLLGKDMTDHDYTSTATLHLVLDHVIHLVRQVMAAKMGAG